MAFQQPNRRFSGKNEFYFQKTNTNSSFQQNAKNRALPNIIYRQNENSKYRPPIPVFRMPPIIYRRVFINRPTRRPISVRPPIRPPIRRFDLPIQPQIRNAPQKISQLPSRNFVIRTTESNLRAQKADHKNIKSPPNSKHKLNKTNKPTVKSILNREETLKVRKTQTQKPNDDKQKSVFADKKRN
ncbi:hypothetical protein MHBO_001352 [Bonamia ostreae]|uniref:Uncharacterized protein n=1 Tax=Bonamia ostreae TaxID=126728 RepID=A0ABV2AIN4_9EUKA